MPGQDTLWPARCFGLLLAAALAGCGALPPKSNVAEDASAGAVGAAPLARIARASLPPGQSSGFRLLPQAGQAFEAREQLIAQATRTIDAQYYHIADDASGRDFLRDLEAAAARGVRVRLLVDDLHTAPIDPALARLARLPGMQVRLFNPFCCARATVATRFAASLFDARRLNRRMHNKLLIADGSLAIAGGRNIADEYFARSPEYEFIDIDALMAGDIVAQLASVFRRYWESEPVWPAQDILAPSLGRHAAPPGPPRNAVSAQDVLGQGPVGAELAAGRLQLVGGSAYAYADSPTKAVGDDEDYLQETSVTTRSRETILTARSDVVISTPYLIPRTKGMAFIANLHQRGVRMRVLTNGAAANDSLFAHLGYARYRHRLLEQGVELYELSSDGAGAGERAGPGLRRWGPAARLHAKAFVVDGQTVFIGSMNLDPRSADTNTELGILAESAPLARQMVQVMDANRRLGALQVRLDAATHRRLQWVADDAAAAPHVIGAEPGMGLLDWIGEVLLFPWIPEALL